MHTRAAYSLVSIVKTAALEGGRCSCDPSSLVAIRVNVRHLPLLDLKKLSYCVAVDNMDCVILSQSFRMYDREHLRILKELGYVTANGSGQREIGRASCRERV